MSDILASTASYEEWLRRELDGELVEADLAKKHRKMSADAFQFLRATYWRWAETIPQALPDLMRAPQLLAIGDAHLENFGTWRDADGRLIWGVNDFDEAAVIPWPFDLVRLGASALLARGDRGPSASEICDALLKGYLRGLDAPEPIVLERDWKWLRKAVLLPERQRADFWDGLAKLPAATPPQRFTKALREALPDGCGVLAWSRRVAGTGSLGRPRFVVSAFWRGGPIVREAKALLPSGWSLAHASDDRAIRAADIAHGRFRASDPHYQVAGAIATRRLSPNSRKIEAAQDIGALLSSDMLRAMGRDIALCHAADDERRVAVLNDLKQRSDGWLRDAVKEAAKITAREQKRYARKAGG